MYIFENDAESDTRTRIHVGHFYSSPNDIAQTWIGRKKVVFQKGFSIIIQLSFLCCIYLLFSNLLNMLACLLNK